MKRNGWQHCLSIIWLIGIEGLRPFINYLWFYKIFSISYTINSIISLELITTKTTLIFDLR